jgi:hypothetical protein
MGVFCFLSSFVCFLFYGLGVGIGVLGVGIRVLGVGIGVLGVGIRVLGVGTGVRVGIGAKNRRSCT